MSQHTVDMSAYAALEVENARLRAALATAGEQIAQAVAEERSRCARVLCPKCAEGDRPQRKDFDNAGETYYHGAWRCAANQIWRGAFMVAPLKVNTPSEAARRSLRDEGHPLFRKDTPDA